MEHIEWLLVGKKFLLALLGILIYATWKVRDHLHEFSFTILIKRNKVFWIWALTMITLVLLVTTLSPDTSSAIKTMIGLDVDGEPSSFLLMGWSLSALSNTISKKKIDKE